MAKYILKLRLGTTNYVAEFERKRLAILHAKKRCRIATLARFCVYKADDLDAPFLVHREHKESKRLVVDYDLAESKIIKYTRTWRAQEPTKKYSSESTYNYISTRALSAS